ncbi:MAG: hypothetical protein NTZ95_01495 [Candidatus Omnitrophica bacterium]|nr:hypothetical protein [Candidatus Omnitrophota bacterium]
MIKFDDKYFTDLVFTGEQVRKNFENALKDLKIAHKDTIADVKFTYSYDALIKGGIALISSYNKKVKSVPGHHVKIIETVSGILNDDTVGAIGNAMRSKRNADFYGGGIEITEKEAREYLDYVDGILHKIEKLLIKY